MVPEAKNLISVIIPTLDAAAGLPGCLHALQGVAEIGEVIIVDGGSTDGSREISVSTGATWLSAPCGRGTQLAVGAGAAQGPWLLFLHADTQLAEDWIAAVRAFLSHPAADKSAAYFRFKLADAGWKPRLLEIAVGLRCSVFSLSYGDQGLLIHQDLYQAAGGFESIALMEDVAMWRQLRSYWRRQTGAETGGFHALNADAVTAADKYVTDGYWRRSFRNLRCLWMYFCGYSPANIAAYYARTGQP